VFGPAPSGACFCLAASRSTCPPRETSLLVRIHFIIVMIRWTGLAPCEFEFPFSGSHTSTFLAPRTTEHKWLSRRIRGLKTIDLVLT